LRCACAFLFALTVSSFGFISLSALGYGQGKQQNDPDVCRGVRSAACRDKAAAVTQEKFNATLPDVRVRAVGDKIVFSDPSLFRKHDERAAFHQLPETQTLENALCQFGFVKIRIESAAAPAIMRDDYDLNCPGAETSLNGANSRYATLIGSKVANPKEKAFDAPVDHVFNAAKRAAAGHRIFVSQDEGLKTLTDSGEEIKSFQFALSLPGVTFRVIEAISAEPLPDGTSTLKVFFHKDRGAIPYLPSASYELRDQQLQNQLERKLSALVAEGERYRIQYEDIHSIDLETYINKQKAIAKGEHEAKLEEIHQQHDAQIADLAGMPTSSFSTMVAAADKFFGLVQQNLKRGR
jgi:hypothetical protein